MNEIQYNAAELDELILFADNHLLAVNKPAGLLTQDSGTGLRNLEDWAREWVRVDKNKPGAVFLNAVHRIDKVVSGVVLFARTSKALSRLNEDVRKRNVKKVYHVLVEGDPGKPTDKLVHWLSHENHKARICKEGHKGAQRAVLSYRKRPPVGNFQCLEVDLETGRYHQIRAQLSAIGCPIVGDAKYGSKTKSPDGAIALHSRELHVMHPTQKEWIKIEAPYPEHSFWH
ncbi:RluA family pseudouridine synthase [Pontiella agarivorans]|uniref:RluA family pseudouridine synthase n=1 Tax=Pontiella agarivorans TaxID=3038953 RepID=A0ABU5MSF0_9BACT|nr:RluA family pseudouridine synthase [Pontiella agarivorans]MDZ8117126.1 RluA family pseudouridine synthase [Pontiella agarivorans]